MVAAPVAVPSTVEPLSTSYEATGKSPAFATVQLSARLCAVASTSWGVPGAPGGTSGVPSHLSPLMRQLSGAAFGPLPMNQKLYGSVVEFGCTVAL